MKKATYRILSLLLSLCVMVACLPTIGVFAVSSTNLEYEGSVSGMPSNNYFSLSGKSVGSTVTYEKPNLLATSSFTFESYKDDGSTGNTMANAAPQYQNLAVDGQYNGADAFLQGATGNSLRNLDAYGTGDCIEFVFKLKKFAKPEAFALVWRGDKTFQAAYYEIYAATNLADLRKSTSQIAIYDRLDQQQSVANGKSDELVDRQVNLFEFGTEMEEARYIRIKILYPDLQTTKYSIKGGSFRAMSMMLFGTETATEVPDESNVQTDNVKYVPTENILDVVEISGNHTMYNESNLSDGNLDTETGANSNFAEYDEENSQEIIYTDGSRKVQITYDFGQVSRISGALVGSHSDMKLRTYEYKLYASNDKSQLYNTGYEIAYFKNDGMNRRQIFSFDQDATKAQYVGIEILFPVSGTQEEFPSLKFTSDQTLYSLRLTEFRVYGSPNVDPINVANCDFENVTGYSNTDFTIEDTGDTAHNKALVFKSSSDKLTLEGQNLGTYNHYDNDHTLFNEALTVGNNYILSYDYKLVSPTDSQETNLFSFALKHQNFYVESDADYLNYAQNMLDTDWHTKTVGFTAETATVNAKAVNLGNNVKAYLDNYNIKNAATITLTGSDTAASLVDKIGNIQTSSKTLNGLTLVAKGDKVSFSVNTSTDYKVASVKMGNETIIADQGVYTIDKVTDNITVATTSSIVVIDPSAVVFNDFENVTGYSNALFPIEDTGDEHGKAIAFTANPSWKELSGKSLGSYTYNNNSYTLFYEDLVVGNHYVLSFDYKLVSPKSFQNAQLFSFALKQEQFFVEKDKDYRSYPQNKFDTEWHTHSVGFTSESNKAEIKGLIIGNNAKSYFDNYTIKQAYTIKTTGSAVAAKVNDLSGNIRKKDQNLNGYDMVVKGDKVVFSVEATSGINIVSVKMGTQTITPVDGVYTINAVSDDIIIETSVNTTMLTDKYKTSGNTIYLSPGESIYSISGKTKIFDEFIKSGDEIKKDQTLLTGDKVYLTNGVTNAAEYTVATLGDVVPDEIINVLDLVDTIDYLIDGTQPDNVTMYDLNADNVVSVTDAVLMRDLVLNGNMYDEDVMYKMEDNLYEILIDACVNYDLDDLEKGVYNYGDRTRIANVLRKAARGEEITIVTFGGSVTEGACSWQQPNNFPTYLSTSNACYTDVIVRWFENSFNCKVKKVNAGISATDSALGVYRLHEDVMVYNPDLIITEFAVNDTNSVIERQGTYEALIREILSNDDVALLMLTMCNPQGAGAQVYHEPLSDHYNVPMTSYRDAFYGGSHFQYMNADSVHPNVLGHSMLALTAIHYFTETWKQIDSIGTIPSEIPSDCYNEQGGYYDGAYMVNLEDVFAAGSAGYKGVKLISAGSFTLDKEKTQFVDSREVMSATISRSYYGATAVYNPNKAYEPMILEVESAKSLMVLMRRFGSNTSVKGRYTVEVNGVLDTDNSLTCSLTDATDNSQTESKYHWASHLIKHSETPEKYTIKITPTGDHEMSKVTLFSLLLS